MSYCVGLSLWKPLPVSKRLPFQPSGSRSAFRVWRAVGTLIVSITAPCVHPEGLLGTASGCSRRGRCLPDPTFTRSSAVRSLRAAPRVRASRPKSNFTYPR